MKKSILATAIASTMVFAAGAEAMSVKVSGQVSKVIVAADDYVGDEVQFLDNLMSGSRWRLTGSGDVGNGITAGFRLEEQLQSNKSNNISDASQETNVADVQDLRYQDLYFKGSYGQVSLGKGDGAANGTAEDDLSGTTIITYSSYDDVFSPYKVSMTRGYGSIYGMADGLSRTNRLRYDSPNFSGFHLAASTGQGGHSEIALRYRGEVSNTKVNASIGYADAHNVVANEAQNTSMSASVLFAGGFNVTVAHGKSEPQKPTGATFDREATYVKLGYIMGIHHFAVDYSEGSLETAGSDDDADSWAISWVATPAKGVEVFASYRVLDADLASNADTDSVDAIAVGSRIRF